MLEDTLVSLSNMLSPSTVLTVYDADPFSRGLLVIVCELLLIPYMNSLTSDLIIVR